MRITPNTEPVVQTDVAGAMLMLLAMPGKPGPSKEALLSAAQHYCHTTVTWL